MPGAGILDERDESVGRSAPGPPSGPIEGEAKRDYSPWVDGVFERYPYPIAQIAIRKGNPGRFRAFWTLGGTAVGLCTMWHAWFSRESCKIPGGPMEHGTCPHGS